VITESSQISYLPHAFKASVVVQYTKFKKLQSIKRKRVLDASDMEALDDVVRELYELIRPNFGPECRSTIVFKSPDPIVITSDGRYVLKAAFTSNNNHDPMTKYVLECADKVYRSIGDGSTQYILMLYSIIQECQHLLRENERVRGQNYRMIEVSMAMGRLRRRIYSISHELFASLRIPIQIQFNPIERIPSDSFLYAMQCVLTSTFYGMFSRDVVRLLMNVMLNWIFLGIQEQDGEIPIPKKTHDMYRILTAYLKKAPQNIIHAPQSGLHQSRVLPREEFFLRKSLVPNQPIKLLETSKRLADQEIHFICFNCTVDYDDGTTEIELQVSSYIEQEIFAQAHHEFLEKFVQQLVKDHEINLIISTQAISKKMVSICTQHEIACVQFAENEEVEELCLRVGITPLASLFDHIDSIEHVGVNEGQLEVIRMEDTTYLTLDDLICTQRKQHASPSYVYVPQMILRASSKGIFKQYYLALLKGLRVVLSLFDRNSLASSPSEENTYAYCCRGGGAAELSLSHKLTSQDILERNPLDTKVQEIFSKTLLHVVKTLRSNMNSTLVSSKISIKKQERAFLNEISSLKLTDDKHIGYVVHSNGPGEIPLPQVVMADPIQYGLIHPIKRIEVLIEFVLQTAEQLLRIDAIVMSNVRIRNRLEEDKDDEEDD
jgi:chaperonin GroEL (HSP60 family)